jgi:uridine kinase
MMLLLNELARSWPPGPGQQLFIGIGGGSGSGKSTIARQLQECLQPLSVCLVNQDRFFKPPAEMPTYFSEYHGEPRPDFNRPDSFYTDAMFAHCRALSGYDVVILEGILALYYPELRELMHLRCYVSLDFQEMLIRRTARNLAAGYGGPYEEIAHYNLECIMPQHRRYNAPTARYADLVIPNDVALAAEREAKMAALCQLIHQVKENDA